MAYSLNENMTFRLLIKWIGNFYRLTQEMNQAEGRKNKKTGCKWNNSWAWGGVVTEKRMTGDTYPVCDCDYVGPKTS